MARRPRVFAPGMLYHVIVRGNQRQKTFLRDYDYEAYLERLAKYRGKWDVTIHAYCLMPNHVHLLVETSNEPLARFMQGVQQSYTQYFNRAHDKVGHLFQGRYKAIVCEKEEYLLQLIRYIHLNPVRAKLARNPEEYKYSGHRAYLSGKSTDLVEPTWVLKLLGGRGGYRRFVLDEIGGGHKEEFYQVRDQRFLGSEEFKEKVETKGEEKAKPKKSLDKAFKELGRQLKRDPAVLRGPDRNWELSRARTLAAYILVRRLGFGAGEVAAYLGRDQTTMSSLISRFSERVQSERQLMVEVQRLTRIV